ncbi:MULTISPECIES: basic amino acid ABC transporter substrate-binding protein [Geobacter]|uniref:basic amino acid ABC transporter substrate-binding protein n=1 Tax=Geobacter TaxID=28231 RepID=UPI0025737F5B|nr:basic amino acid ABC transporter substrate-binding protein [Geobacter sulfurreducens]BEH11939.1 basic amino acid ABC transporter substrate-binding protein [Geobacter sulfurreducens subsp. ethanolicus]BET59805.1 basic amino acid ABC transporter substrate-binding protein [Geobacter sp. 60473]HML77213.1 basic amino acid ABC transporter substrate-binding protein [Geobacter sulfurreducens]
MNLVRRTLMVLTLAAVCLTAAVPRQAEAAGRTVTVATDATWPPMEMVDANKKIVGFDIDFMNAIAKEAGFAVQFKNTAWDGIFAGLGAGRYDAIISSVTITEERKKQYDFSDPYINIGQILVVPKTEKAANLPGLKGKKVGAQIGTTGAFEIKKVQGVELKNYDEIGLAFEDMAAGRIAGVVCDEPTAAHYALQKTEYKNKFKIVGKSFTAESYGIVVKKGDKELLALINKGIKAVKAKKVDEQLRKKWLR